MRFRRIAGPAICVIAFPLAAATAMQDTHPGPATRATRPGPARDAISAEGDWVIVSMADETAGIPLKSFVTLAQPFLPRSLVVNWEANPHADRERIDLIGPLRIKKENFFEFFSMVLSLEDYAVVPRSVGDTKFHEIVYRGRGRRAEGGGTRRDDGVTPPPGTRPASRPR